MTWTLHVSARDRRKLYSRLFLVLEQQMVAILSMHAVSNQGVVQITIALSSEEEKAYRIESLLHRLQDVIDIRIETSEP